MRIKLTFTDKEAAKARKRMKKYGFKRLGDFIKALVIADLIAAGKIKPKEIAAIRGKQYLRVPPLALPV